MGSKNIPKSKYIRNILPSPKIMVAAPKAIEYTQTHEDCRKQALGA